LSRRAWSAFDGLNQKPLREPIHLTIDKSGRWWKGEDFDDLAEYIRTLTAEGYPAERIVQSICACGGTVFRLEADAEEGCARRTCVGCEATAFICDSGEYWADAEPEPVACPCGGEQFELGVGFSPRANGDVRWITVGERCTRCGILGSATDWKIDYGPTDRLFDQV